MKEKYNIDAGRIYMQGMSMGNAMTGQFARYMGSILAGAAGSGCPTNSKLLFDNRHKVINQSGPLDIWQSRLELDKVPPHYREGDHETIRYNLEYWNLVNGCDALPQIGIRDEYNFAFYKGSQGNNVLMDVKTGITDRLLMMLNWYGIIFFPDVIKMKVAGCTTVSQEKNGV